MPRSRRYLVPSTVEQLTAALYEGSRAQIQGAIDALVKRAIKNGDIRRDLDPFDLHRALIGVSHVASGPDWQQASGDSWNPQLSLLKS